MSDVAWDQVKDLLFQAMQVDSQERMRFLDEACAGNESLRAELVSLLAAAAATPPRFLESLPSELSRSTRQEDTLAPLEVGQLFEGRFRLLRLLGEGGMGQVWLAEQMAPVRREVALKLIRSGAFDPSILRRFIVERQSLAIMDHPAIAKVFEAGATSQGQPWFAMEYVPGLPITEYADLHRLDLRERVELLAHACDGVQHAHVKSVIHRDIKPANVLVVEVHGKPVPRLIDFGLAKATTPSAPDQSLHTRLGLISGTPGYMSPEQAHANPQDIDTRTDVYSLGVLLYVLLTGLQPFEIRRRAPPPIDEWLRQLREDEPPWPSAKLAADRESAATSAADRLTEPRTLIRQLRGDLDWITIKALARDRERRYGSAAELAADLRRYLQHEPVLARPPTWAYRTRKYLRRHRLGVAVAATLVLLLAGFSVVQSMQLRVITRERDRVTRISEFMTDMFQAADPTETSGREVTARTVLDRASADIRSGLHQDRETQAQLMHVMARSYVNLGLYRDALALARSASEARAQLYGPNDARTLDSRELYGWTLSRANQDAEAEPVLRDVLARERTTLARGDPRLLEAMRALSTVLVNEGGHNGEAEALVRQHLDLARTTFGPASLQTVRAMGVLGRLLLDEGRYAEAERTLRRLLDVAPRTLRADHPQILQAMTYLGFSVASQRREQEAEVIYRKALAEQMRVVGPEHSLTTMTMDWLAVCLGAQGRFEEAETLSRAAFATRLKSLGPEHYETLTSMFNLGEVLRGEGRLQESESILREAVSRSVHALGAESTDTLATQSSLAKTLNAEGRYADAEQLARSTLDAQLPILGPHDPDSIATQRELGKALAHEHRYAEAVSLLRALMAQKSKAADQGNLWSGWYDLACVAAAADQPRDALGYLREAIQRGYVDANGLAIDSDLASLRSNADFQQVLADLRRRTPPPD